MEETSIFQVQVILTSFLTRSSLFSQHRRYVIHRTLTKISYSIVFILWSISREDCDRLIHKKLEEATKDKYIFFLNTCNEIFKLYLNSKNQKKYPHICWSDSIKITRILYDIIAELYTIHLFLVVQEECWTAHPEEIDARYQSRPMTSLGCYPIMIFFLSFPTRNLSLGQTSNRNFIPRWLFYSIRQIIIEQVEKKKKLDQTFYVSRNKSIRNWTAACYRVAFTHIWSTTRNT